MSAVKPGKSRDTESLFTKNEQPGCSWCRTMEYNGADNDGTWRHSGTSTILGPTRRWAVPTPIDGTGASLARVT